MLGHYLSLYVYIWTSPTSQGSPIVVRRVAVGKLMYYLVGEETLQE